MGNSKSLFHDLSNGKVLVYKYFDENLLLAEMKTHRLGTGLYVVCNEDEIEAVSADLSDKVISLNKKDVKRNAKKLIGFRKKEQVFISKSEGR